MDKDLADQVAGIAARVVASGAISANGHGNVSVRVPGAEEMYFTAGPSLRGHPASAVVRVGLDGTLLEGEIPPDLRAAALQRAMIDDRAQPGRPPPRPADPPRAAGCPRPAASGGHDRSLRDVPPGRRGPAWRLGNQLERQPADRDARNVGQRRLR